jgi:uncharacterized protein YdeI (YjbR/CyaY-like superfamily)
MGIHSVKKDKTLHVTNRDEWRAWLEENHAAEREVWLIYHKRHTGSPRIPYDDAVEEAICFGWIDSIVRKLDEEKYAQKFTPRNDKSKWSELNRRRAERMIKEGRMTEAGLAKFQQAGKPDAKAAAMRAPGKKLVVPPDLREALAANKKAQENFNNFAPGYKRLYIRWISAAKRPETRAKRIKQTVKWSSENKKPGML